MVKIKLYTMHHSPLKQLGMLQRGDRIHLQGWIPTGVRQEEGIIVIQVWNYCDSLLHLILLTGSD